MTLQLLPPHDVYHFDFDSDIKDGIRPPFIDEVNSCYRIVGFFEVLKFCKFHRFDRFMKFKSSKN